MAKKTAGPVDPLKAKEAKQKKIAIGGAVLLVILLIVQVPKIMKQTSHSTAPPAQPTSTTGGVTATPVATTPAASTPATPFAAAPSASGGSSSGLLSEAAPTAAIGQLSSFGTFVSKDPFASQIPAAGSTVASPTGGKKGGGGTTTTAQPPAPPSPPTAPAPAPTTEVIAVNGVKAQVSVGSDFPVGQPFFHLVSATAHTAKISIAGGSLANGAGTLTLHEGKTVTLQNTTDGTRYTLELFPQGTSLAATTTVPAAGSTTTAPVTTVPTTTGGTTTGP